MKYDKLISIQVQNQDTEQWTDWLSKPLHATVNKTGGGQALNAGADQYRASLTFEVRYFPALESLRDQPQLYRILYRGRTYKLTDYDDYMEQHRTVRLAGELYE